jgi:hypothetical protein
MHNGGRAEAEQCWGMVAEMAERGRPSALCMLFIAVLGCGCGNGGKAARVAARMVAVVKLGAAEWRRPLPKCWRRGWAPLFRQGHRSVGPALFLIFLIYPKLAQL